MKHLVCFLFLLSFLNSGAQTAVRVLVRVDSFSQVQGHVIDSSFFVYSGGRGSDAVNDSYNYDSCHIVHYCPGCPSVLPDQLLLKEYDGGNNLIQYTEMELTGPGGWVVKKREEYTYDANGNLLMRLNLKNGIENDDKDSFSYNGNNGMLSRVYSKYDTGGVNVQYQQTRLYIYGSGNSPAEVLYQTGNPGNLQNLYHYTYLYDGAGQLINDYRENWNGTTWINNAFYTHSYIGSHLVLTVGQSWLANGWNNGLKDSIIYANGVPVIIQGKGWSGQLNAWVNVRLDSFRYDNDGNKIYDASYYWDHFSAAYTTGIRTVAAYNSHGQPEYYNYQEWSGPFPGQGQWGWNHPGKSWSRFYYETYTSVATVQSDTFSFSLYPVPADRQLTISLNQAQIRPLTFRIYDCNGRLLRQWIERTTGQLCKLIPVSDLEDGVYTLTVNGEQGKRASKFIVHH